MNAIQSHIFMIFTSSPGCGKAMISRYISSQRRQVVGFTISLVLHYESLSIVFGQARTTSMSAS